MVSHVHSHSSSWERPTTPAPQMDAQMGSCGALHPQTLRKTSSTLSVLRRMVRLRNRVVNLVDILGLYSFSVSVITTNLFKVPF